MVKAQFDKSTNLFCWTFLTPFICSIFYTTDTIGFHCNLLSGNIFLAITFIAFDFMILSDLICNSNNLVEISFYWSFLVDCLMCLSISLKALKTLKSSFSGSILINLQSSSCSIAFCLFISWSIFLSLCPFPSISIESL